ncbi:MAG: hypothetical protein QS98_C0012G0014 [archaeon GW2011_AR3]|nr:MAG: hypothetical protein QS98_C0012G0014 [archaeon GW2011_AR3]MBS3108998.1 VWA domain-containing protein [Candidatus Woesearchaeota archaeon]
MAFDMYTEVEEQTPFEEERQKGFSRSESELTHSITDADKESIDEGKLVSDAINQNLSSFNPDIMIEQMVKNFSLAKSMYGDSIIRRISGYDSSYINKNIRIPEFARELRNKLKERLQKLKDNQVIDSDGSFTDKGYDLASFVLYMEELNNIIPKGMLGEKIHKKANVYGDASDTRGYKRGDRFRDLSLKKSVRQVIRRKHTSLKEEDLVVYDRKSRGKLSIIYAIDASGSMRGQKIEICKKAGIALAYKAINEKDEVGLLSFGTDIKEKISPTTDFQRLLRAITMIRASMQTNIADTIMQSIDMFPRVHSTKHLLLLTDALPTFGDSPEEETLEAVSMARTSGITLSLIGINLDDKGEKFAKKMAETGEGRFYVVKNLKELDKIVLEDYYASI